MQGKITMSSKKIKINFEGVTHEVEISVKDVTTDQIYMLVSIEGKTYTVNVSKGLSETLSQKNSFKVKKISEKKIEQLKMKDVERSLRALPTTDREEEIIKCPLPGKVLAIKVSLNSKVSRGDVLIILESMKMENEIIAPRDGIISDLKVTVGDSLNINDILLTLK